MATKATLKFIQVSPQKARLVANLVRNKSATEATLLLKVSPTKTARYLTSLIKSAVSNASQNTKVNPDKLYIKEICVNPGPIIHMINTRAQGRATPKNRRTSHFKVVLEERR